jgi:UPF0271 protein
MINQYYKPFFNIIMPISFMLYLIDSSAVLNDFGFEFEPKNRYVTTPLAIGEFKDMRSRHLMENALQQRALSIEEPTATSLRYVEETALEKGFRRLSKTDLSLIALALDLKKQGQRFTLLSDDYSIQNFCSLFKIPFKGIIRGEIKKEISFSLQCTGCGKAITASSKAKKCPDCGSPLKRKKLASA